MKIILAFILGVLPNLLMSQLHDTIQRRCLMENGIKKITKTKLSHDADSTRQFILAIEEINEKGYMTNIKSFNSKNELIQTYEYNYANDTLLKESRMTSLNHPNRSVNLTTYTYGDSKYPETCNFYFGQDLKSSLKFEYSKEGLLETINQTWYDSNNHGKKKGHGKTRYTYNSEGKTTNSIVKRRLDGKVKKEFYRYKYDLKNKVIEKYVKYESGQTEMLLERTELDENNRIISEETYFFKNATLNTGTTEFKINKGDSFQKKFIYNNRGLIEQEINQVNESQVVEILYNYTTDASYR